MQKNDSHEQVISGAYELFPELVGYCLNQKTAEDAVLSYIRNRVIVGNCDSYTIRKEDDHLAVSYVEDIGMPQRNYSAIGNFMVLRELVRLYAPATETVVALRWADDSGRKRLDDAFGCHCQFGQDANVIYFKGADLVTPAETYLPLLNKNQHQHITKKVAVLEHEQGFSSLIYSLVDEVIENDNVKDGASFMDHICAVMGMSRWTINTRLNHEEKNFSMILKMVRIKKACLLLSETRMSIQDISERLRFSSPAVFSRFFSTHISASPLQYRRRFFHLK